MISLRNSSREMGFQGFKSGKENSKDASEEGTQESYTDRSQLDLPFGGQVPGTVHEHSILGQELERGESSQNQTQLTAPHQGYTALCASSLPQSSRPESQ